MGAAAYRCEIVYDGSSGDSQRLLYQWSSQRRYIACFSDVSFYFTMIPAFYYHTRSLGSNVSDLSPGFGNFDLDNISNKHG